MEVDDGLAHTSLECGFERKSKLQGLVELIGALWRGEVQRRACIDGLARRRDAPNRVRVSVLRWRHGVVGVNQVGMVQVSSRMREERREKRSRRGGRSRSRSRSTRDSRLTLQLPNLVIAMSLFKLAGKHKRRYPNAVRRFPGIRDVFTLSIGRSLSWLWSAIYE